MRWPFVVAAIPVAAILLLACGGAVKMNGSPGDDAGDVTVQPSRDGGCFGVNCAVDSGTPTPVQLPPDPSYPTSHAPIPPVTYNGGNVIDAAKIVTVTYDGDTLRGALEKFDDLITTTAWWDAVSAEYCDARGKCIGHGTSGGYARIAAPNSTSYDDTSTTDSSSLKQYIDAQIQSSAFPLPDAETLYVIYFPAATKITLDGSPACQAFGAYHNAMTSTPPGGAAPVQFAYAIIPRCPDQTGLDQQDELTHAASHEIIEAATDPYILPGGQTYYAFGSSSDGWDYTGGEVADRCLDLTGQSSDNYTESGYVVQRSWSNAAAKASHDPCVPAPAPSQEPYFNLAPKGGDVLSMAVGQVLTVQLVAFSDGPTGPLTLDAFETSEYYGLTNVLDLSLDFDAAQNGQNVDLSVTLTSPPSQGTATFVVSSNAADGTTHAWSFVVNSM
jgi:hypothetical protein